MSQTQHERVRSSINTIPGIANAYIYAKDVVARSGFADEIAWQAGIRLDAVSEQYFLREAAWVVLSAGMRESVVRKVFPAISQAFLNWCDAAGIVNARAKCVAAGRETFNHEKKINAIADIASHVYCNGFDWVMKSIRIQGIEYLQTLPFIGPITSFHLAKNLGMDVVKPDRHLIRVADATGYGTPEEMCRVIASAVGDAIPVVDLVIWRFATLEPRYMTIWANATSQDHLA